MKTSIEKIRRRELAEAAFETVKEHGVGGATVSRVSARAGMSQGLVHHYFESKADLLEAAMRQTNARYRNQVLDLVRKADTPRGKLYAVVEAAFLPDIFNRSFAQACLSFCGEAAFTPRYARVQRVMFARMRSNLVYYLRSLMPPEEVEATAKTINMLSHGIWLRNALDSEPIGREEALAHMFRMVDLLLAESAARH
jgi:TetR/AcrR family transcriptional repressor of bet genes